MIVWKRDGHLWWFAGILRGWGFRSLDVRHVAPGDYGLSDTWTGKVRPWRTF